MRVNNYDSCSGVERWKRGCQSAASAPNHIHTQAQGKVKCVAQGHKDNMHQSEPSYRLLTFGTVDELSHCCQRVDALQLLP